MNEQQSIVRCIVTVFDRFEASCDNGGRPRRFRKTTVVDLFADALVSSVTFSSREKHGERFSDQIQRVLLPWSGMILPAERIFRNSRLSVCRKRVETIAVPSGAFADGSAFAEAVRVGADGRLGFVDERRMDDFA